MTQQDDYAKAIILAGQKRGITPRGIEIALATVYVESDFIMYANESDPASLNFPHQGISSDANSDGLFQQRDPWWGTVACRMDAACSAGLFYDHLVKLDYNNPDNSPGSYAQAVQQSAFPDRYDQRFQDAVDLYNRLVGESGVPDVRPDFNEFPIWCDNNEDRSGTTIDLWLIHTQEGGGGDSAAEDLANFLVSTTGGPNPVSYHYTISQASDGGVTVVDCVDTDYACWAVGDANDRSINLCFAGSSINWTRDQWLQQSHAIDVAGFLCAADCIKYNTLPKVIPPPYNSDPPGVSDHRYVTEHLGWGNHTDVGDNFPWATFTQSVTKWYQALRATPVIPPLPPAPVPSPTPTPLPPDGDFETWLANASDKALLQYIAAQLGPGDPSWASKGETLRDFVWSLQSAQQKAATKRAVAAKAAPKKATPAKTTAPKKVIKK